MNARFVVVRGLVIAALAFAGSAQAQVTPERSDATPLTLEEVIRAALARSPALAAAEQERFIAAADARSAAGGFDPSWKTRGVLEPYGVYPSRYVDSVVEVPTTLWGARPFAGYRIGLGDFAVYDGKLATADRGEVRGGVTVPVLRDGPIDRRRAAIQRADLGIEGARLSIEQQRIELVRAASFRYWEWVVSGQRVKIARDLLEMTVARDAGLALRVERGDLPELERIETLRAMAQRRSQLASAERSLQNAAIELSMFFRGPDGEPVLATTGRQPPSLLLPSAVAITRSPDDEQRAIARRPEVHRFKVSEEQSKIDLRLAENQKLPGVDVFGAVSRDLGGGDPKKYGTEVEVGVLVDVPLLNRVQDGRARAASASAAGAAARGRLARDRIVADVRDASSAIDQSRERALAARGEVDVATRLVLGERQRFAQGDGTLLFVNLREQALGEAEIREAEALGDHHRAVAAYRAATAEPPAP